MAAGALAGAVAAGVGYGLMHTAMMYGAVLSASGGEAAWVRDACPRINAFAMTAAQALLLNLLHVPLTVVAFDADRRWSAARAAVPVAIPLAFAHVGVLVAGPTPAACERISERCRSRRSSGEIAVVASDPNPVESP